MCPETIVHPCMYSWRTCHPSDAWGTSTTDAVPMSIPKCLRPSAILGVDGRAASNTDYCCQTYVPFSDEDRHTSQDHPQSRPFIHQQLVFEASSRWVLHKEAVMLRRMFESESSVALVYATELKLCLSLASHVRKKVVKWRHRHDRVDLLRWDEVWVQSVSTSSSASSMSCPHAKRFQEFAGWSSRPAMTGRGKAGGRPERVFALPLRLRSSCWDLSSGDDDDDQNPRPVAVYLFIYFI